MREFIPESENGFNGLFDEGLNPEEEFPARVLADSMKIPTAPQTTSRVHEPVHSNAIPRHDDLSFIQACV
jgi:hypothetical protein